MGVTYGNLKRAKNKTFSKKISYDNENISLNNVKRRITVSNTSKIKKNFNEKKKNSEIIPKSKADKILEIQNKNETTTSASTYNEDIKTIKSLSLDNITKIEGGKHLSENINPEELNRNSIDTNYSSNPSYKEISNKLLSAEMNNDLGDNNCFDEEEDEEEEESEESDTKKEERKINKLLITNNIKAVFIDSKIKEKDKNENDNSNNININDGNSTNISSRTSSVIFDYELNFYKSGNEIRESYISKLISKKVWNPSIKPKQHNSIIIFDWDDTLLPTSFLTPGGVFNQNIILSEKERDKLLKIEQCVFLLLSEAIEKGNVYIITNAGKGWVEYSANKFYPSIMEILSKIQIISAREYEKQFSDLRQWKIQTFLTLLKHVNIKLVTNIICIGDSLFEMEAGRILASKFTEAFIKTIKFRENPKLDELLKQLTLVCHQFGTIYSSIRNLTIRVEKKKKESI